MTDNMQHLATVLWNVLRANGPWKKSDLADLEAYVRKAGFARGMKDYVLREIGNQAGKATEK